MAEPFFDTNVLLYLLSDDAAKANVAESVLAGGGHLSVQVLNEFTSVARRKAWLDWSEIDEVLDPVRGLCTVHPLTTETYDRARELAEQHRLGCWDGLLVASALLARCTVLLTEDLNSGEKFEGLTVRNPFRSVASGRAGVSASRLPGRTRAKRVASIALCPAPGPSSYSCAEGPLLKLRHRRCSFIR